MQPLAPVSTSSSDFHKPITGKFRDGIISGVTNPLAARYEQSQIGSVLQISSYPVMPRPPHEGEEVTTAQCRRGHGAHPLAPAQDSLMHIICPQPQHG